MLIKTNYLLQMVTKMSTVLTILRHSKSWLKTSVTEIWQ